MHAPCLTRLTRPAGLPALPARSTSPLPHPRGEHTQRPSPTGPAPQTPLAPRPPAAHPPLQLTLQQQWDTSGQRTAHLAAALPQGLTSAAGVIAAIEAGALDVHDLLRRMQVGRAQPARLWLAPMGRSAPQAGGRHARTWWGPDAIVRVGCLACMHGAGRPLCLLHLHVGCRGAQGGHLAASHHAQPRC